MNNIIIGAVTHPILGGAFTTEWNKFTADGIGAIIKSLLVVVGMFLAVYAIFRFVANISRGAGPAVMAAMPLFVGAAILIQPGLMTEIIDIIIAIIGAVLDTFQKDIPT